MKRWTHLHTLMTGGILGFGAATRLWWVVPVALVLGFASGILFSHARHAARSATAKVVQLHDAKVATERAREVSLLSQAYERKLTRLEQQKAEDRAYVRGAADQLHHLEAG